MNNNILLGMILFFGLWVSWALYDLAKSSDRSLKEIYKDIKNQKG